MKTYSKETQTILAALNDEQQQLLADMIKFGYWGDTDMELGADPLRVAVYMPQHAHEAGHFERKTLSRKFQTLYKALGMTGDNKSKVRAGQICWIKDWYGEGSSDSYFFVRNDLANELEAWEEEYSKNKPF